MIVGIKAVGTWSRVLTAALGDKGAEQWPKINNGTDNATLNGSSDNGKPYEADASATVAKDLIDLNREEKAIVAGLLAKTIEGGEVVEIRAVSSTSVMVNACYDLLKENQSHYLSGCCNLIFQLL